MTPPDIRAAVTITGDALVLTETTLGSDAITALLTEYGQDGTLTITGATVVSATDDPFVDVHGDLGLLGVAVTGTARFWSDGTSAQLDFAGTPPPSWTLDTSFTALRGTDLATLPITAPRLHLRSAPPGSGEEHTEHPDDPTGLTLRTGFTLPAVLEAVSLFGRPADGATLTGPLRLDAGAPSLTLTADPPITLQLSDQATMSLTVQHITHLARKNPGAPPVVTTVSLLRGDVRFEHEGTPVDVPMLAAFSDGTGLLTLSMDTTDVFALGLSDITHWLGGTELAKDGLPESFQPPGGLTLTDVTFAIGLRTARLEHVALTISSTEPWDVVGKVSISDIVIRFVVMPNRTPKLAANIEGTLKLDTVWLDVYAQSDFLIRGHLADRTQPAVGDGATAGEGTAGEGTAGEGTAGEGTAGDDTTGDDTTGDDATAAPGADLAALIRELAGDVPGLPSTLTIDALSFEAYPGDSTYSFEIDVSGEWTIVDGLTVRELRTALSYTSGGFDLSFGGRWRIGGDDGVDIACAVTHDGTGTTTLSGGAADTTPIRIGSFVQQLVDHFGSTPGQRLPDEIGSLEILHLTAEYDSSSGGGAGPATTAFEFGCEARFPVAGRELDLKLRITVRKEGTGYTHVFGGVITFGRLEFDLLFESDSAPASGTDTGAQGAPVASSMFLAAVQPGESVDVRALVASVDDTAGTMMPALSVAIEDALFLYRKVGTGPATFVFGLALGIGLDLSTLPLVGPVFTGAGAGKVRDVQVLYASAPVTTDDLAAFNGLIAQAQAKPPLPVRPGGTGTAPALQQGFNLAAAVDLGGSPLPIGAGGNTADTGAPVSPTDPTAPVPSRPPAGNASWIDVRRSIGPVTLERIGVRYQDGRAWLLLDAGVVISGLSVGLQGLALGVTLNDPEDVSAHLDGMSIDYESGPLTIAGGFLKLGGDYLGEAKVRAASFGLTAIGGYAPDDESFFIFARLTAPLGGPPFFFVTGIAGGFGINRDLLVPPIDRLLSFPLLPAVNTFPAALPVGPSTGTGTGTDGATTPSPLVETLTTLGTYIRPRAGQNWAAVGVDFTSFEMVESSALVTVSFGVEFAVALLGVSRITVPTGEPEPIVFLEITLAARVKPAEGVLAVDGRVTPASFLFDRACRITGGFAFYVWFAGEHAGDFVVTVGGYHPRFVRPAHYPVVPRMGIQYRVDALVVKGETYLALTPHLLMAGLRLDATWSRGDLRAWFNAGLDFLLGWRPFHYEANAFVHIGVSLRVDALFATIPITIHVGVDLSLWGPPFGGTATIDLDVVSFTIRFGDDPRREAVDWAAFKKAFLPAGTDRSAVASPPAAGARVTSAAEPDPDGLLCTASVDAGLVGDLKAKDATEFLSWIVDANHFVIRSSTLIPSKTAAYNTTDRPVSWETGFGVLPVGLGPDAFHTHHSVRIARSPNPGARDAASFVDDVVEDDEVTVEPVLQSASSALWAGSPPGMNDRPLLSGTLAGLRVTPAPQHPDVTASADLWALLFDQNQRVDGRADVPEPSRDDPYAATVDEDTLTFRLDDTPVVCRHYQLTALTEPSVSARRRAAVAGLRDLGFAFDPDDVDVDGLARYPSRDWPTIRTLGAEVAAS